MRARSSVSQYRVFPPSSSSLSTVATRLLVQCFLTEQKTSYISFMDSTTIGVLVARWFSIKVCHYKTQIYPKIKKSYEKKLPNSGKNFSSRTTKLIKPTFGASPGILFGAISQNLMRSVALILPFTCAEKTFYTRERRNFLHLEAPRKK